MSRTTKSKLIAVTVAALLLVGIVVSSIMGIKQREQLNAQRGILAPTLVISVQQ